MMVTKKSPFHLVDMSPWPLITSFNLMTLTLGITYWFTMKSYSLIMVMGIFMTILSVLQWWRDTSRESSYQGLHTNVVLQGLKMGMILFIISEVMFFFSIFWGSFHNSLSPTIEMGMYWPPQGVMPFNPLQTPLLNTIILLTSGMTITWSHHELMSNKMSSSKNKMLLTLLLGSNFSFLQYLEYSEASFCMSDSAFGSSFFMATGFHGIHVLIGSLFIAVTMIRMNFNLMSKTHHFGFEASAWYWHFVDVVWIILYVSLYWWGV